MHLTGGRQDDRISDAYSPEWMRVAFGLERTPSLLDVHMEFSHLAVNALTHAIQACSFQQYQRRDKRSKISDRQMLIDMGIDVSMEAYGEGNKDWVIDMIRSHPYIIETLIDSFAILWGRLLESTVQENCDRISRGITSKGLVSSVRASHKWLLSDFLLSIIKNDLAAHWALEALGRLPKIVSLSSKDFTNINRDWFTRENQTKGDKLLMNSGTIVNIQDINLIATTLHILRAIVTIRSFDCEQLPLICHSARVDCNDSRLALTPLYHSLMRMLEGIIPQASSKANRSRTRNSVGSRINHEAAILRNIIGENKSYCDIASAIMIIESKPEAWKAWSRDFIIVTLDYGDIGHSELEIEFLSSLAMTLPGILPPIGCAKSDHREGDICRWLLLKKDLKNHLYKISHLLIITRTILSADDLRDVLGSLLQNEICVVENQIYPLLIRRCVKHLWERLLILSDFTESNFSLERDQEGVDKKLWIQCIRDLTGMNEFSVDFLLTEKSEGILGEGDSRKLFVMAIIFKIMGITGLDPSFLSGLMAEIINRSVSLDVFYPVQITLTLLAHAATILNEKIDGKCNIHDEDSHKDSSSEISFSRDKVLAHVTNECLDWILNVFDLNIDISGIIILIAGLLGNTDIISEKLVYFHDMGDLIVESLSSLFMSLTLSAKCDMIHHLMLVNEGICTVLNDILDTNLLRNDIEYDRKVQSVEGCYIPNLVAAGLTEYISHNIFESKMVNPDGRFIKFDEGIEGSIIGHSIVFRTIHLSHRMDSNTSSNIFDDAAKCFMSSHKENEFNGSIIGKITRASRIVHLLSLAAKTLANTIVERESYDNEYDTLLSFTNEDNLQAISIAIASAPRIWSLFFLANLPNIVTLTAILHSENLLEHLGIAWYYSKPFTDDLVFGSEITDRKESKHYFIACLLGIDYASVMIAYESQRLELSPCKSQTLLYQDRTSIGGKGTHTLLLFIQY